MESRGYLLSLSSPRHAWEIEGCCVFVGVAALGVLAPSDFFSLPQRAGYSLQELFHLTRSQVSQQRVLALHVLAQVVGRVSGLLAWSCLSPPHPPTLDFPTSHLFLSGPLAHTPAVCESDWEQDKYRVIDGQGKV